MVNDTSGAIAAEQQQLSHQQSILSIAKTEPTEDSQASASGLSLLVAAVDSQYFDSMSGNEQGNSKSISPAISESNSTISASGRRRSIPDTEKDSAYWEKRRRNNDAAKRSREKRRINDMAIEQRLMELSKENSALKTELQQKITRPAAVVEPTSLHTNPTPTPLGLPPSALIKTEAHSHPVPRPSVINMTTQMDPSALLMAQQMPFGYLQPNLQQPLQPKPGHMSGLNHSLTGSAFQPPTSQHQNLLAMLPQNNLLQHLSAAAAFSQAQAALAQQSNRGLLAPLSQQLAPPPLNLTTKQPSPDSTMERLMSNRDPVIQTAPPPPSGMDGKQYLRYKLLEKQNRREQNKAAVSSGNPNGILGALLSSGKPPVPAEVPRPSVPVLPTGVPNNLSLKQCLSSLAIPLGSDSSSAPADSSTSGSGGGPSDSSAPSEGSQLSPTSSHDAESHSSGGSQPSPPQAILSALGLNGVQSAARSGDSEDGCSGKYGSETERYMERRRRNNEAAKRCRANRRALFEYRFKRAQQLETENGQLKDEVQRLGRELMELKALLARREGKLDSQPREVKPAVQTPTQRLEPNPTDHSDSGVSEDIPMDTDSERLVIADETLSKVDEQ